MTNEMSAFLKELADLIDKHEVDVGIDHEGINLHQDSKYEEGKLVREYCDVDVYSSETYDLRQLAKQTST